MASASDAAHESAKPPAIAEAIHRLCLKRGWNQGELARRAGISRTTLYQILRGGVQQPRYSTLKKLGDALETSVEELTESSPPTQPLAMSLPASPRGFDESTNTCVQEVCDEHPELFAGWSPLEWEELYSTFGTGGQLTPHGVEQMAQHINRKRDVQRKLSIVLETHLHDVAANLVDSLFEMVQPAALRRDAGPHSSAGAEEQSGIHNPG